MQTPCYCYHCGNKYGTTALLPLPEYVLFWRHVVSSERMQYWHHYQELYGGAPIDGLYCKKCWFELTKRRFGRK